MTEATPQWSDFTKRAIALIVLLLLALMIYRFREILPPLMIASLLAFILNPIAGFIVERLHISRGLATGLVFLVLVAAMLGTLAAPVTAVPNVVRAVRTAQFDFIRFTNDIGAFFEQPLQVGDYSLDLSDAYQELSSMLTSFVASVAEGTLDVVLNIASGALWLLFIMITAFYLVKDADRFTEGLDSLAPPGHREDFARIRCQIADVWNRFLRGQLVMGLVMVVITTVVCTAIGLPYALVMGLIAGITEFIPNIGPIIALVPAALVALFKGSSFLPLSNFWFMVLVIGLYMVIQQVEGNVILPRILGESLNLHPLVVMIGIIIGGNMTGILGMLLAAPVLATLRVIGSYIFRRLYDSDPFPKPDQEAEPSQPGLVEQACLAAWYRLQETVEEALESRKERADRGEGQGGVLIRPARSTDRSAVEAICAKRGEDYVSNVWDEWLAECDGALLLAESQGQVVGLAKLTRLAEDEWWLQGLRVDPDHQRKGIAGRLQTCLIEIARHTGHGTLRFGTHSTNEAVHCLAARDSFRHIATYERYRADPLTSEGATHAPSLYRLTEPEVAEAWALISESPRLRASSGLYEDAWTWRNLTRERLAHHVIAGDVWGMGRPDENRDGVGGGEERAGGGLWGLALVCGVEQAGPLYVGYVDGADDALTPVLQGLRGLASQLDCAEVIAIFVNEPVLLAAVKAAGYERNRDRDLWIFELGLSLANSRE
jgi:predicted PurR-regulated permease PerM/GNAT superfamily N-acetyltransferase